MNLRRDNKKARRCRARVAAKLRRPGQAGTRAQLVELTFVFHPLMTDVTGTKEAAMLMTLLRTVTPSKMPE